MKRVTQQYQRWMRLIIVTGWFVAGALDLHAQTNIWTNTASGFWTNTVGYWSLPHAPTNTDVIDYITNALSKTVTIDANTPVGNLTISNLTIKGCSGATNTLYLSGNTTPFTVLGPTVLDSADASSLGALVINGGLAAVTNGTAPQMTVGYTYVGSLMVSNSGVLVVNGMKLSSSSAGAQGTLTIFGGTVTNLGALYVGNNANATGNVMLISGTLMSTNGSSHTDYIGQGTGSSANMTISNGLFESYAPLFGYGANSRCTLTIAGGTNIFCTPYLGYLNGSIGTIVMTNGQMEVTNFNSGSSCIKIGGNASTGVGNLIVSNGTLYVSVINGSSSSVGNSSNAQGTVTIAGGNSIFGQALTCGNGTNSSGTILMTGGSLQIYGGGVGNVGALVLGGSGSNNVGTFTQSGGSSIFGRTTQTNFIGNVIGNMGNYTVLGGTNQIKGCLLLGYVPNSTGNVWITGGQLSNTVSILNGYSGVGAMTVSNGIWWAGVNVIGYNPGASGTLNIQGGTGTVAVATTVGLYAGATGNVIMSGGYLVSPAVLLCSNGTLAASANFLVCSGAVLEANTVVSPNASGSGGFSNLNSGVWQFTSNTPVVTNNNSNIVVSNATIAFRAIANADVKGNWTGSQLTNVLWQGTNTFCLNAASNTMAINQNYTFASGLGSTNYVALKLINGAIYRNGNVNIGTNGNGGSLMVQGGPCTIASNLTMNSLSTLALTVGSSSDYLIVTNGTANLGLATLQLTFNTCPTNLYPLTIVQANAVQNSFGSPQIRASYLGSNYTIQVRSSNNSIYLTWPGPPGTGIFFW